MFPVLCEMVFHLSFQAYDFSELSCQLRKVLNSVVDVFCCGDFNCCVAH